MDPTTPNNSLEKSNEQLEDCYPCKISGFAVGVGGGYFAFRKALELQKRGSPQNKVVALGVTSVLLTSAGVYRLLFYKP